MGLEIGGSYVELEFGEADMELELQEAKVELELQEAYVELGFDEVGAELEFGEADMELELQEAKVELEFDAMEGVGKGGIGAGVGVLHGDAGNVPNGDGGGGIIIVDCEGECR